MQCIKVCNTNKISNLFNNMEEEYMHNIIQNDKIGFLIFSNLKKIILSLMLSQLPKQMQIEIGQGIL